jgi:polyhydroxyalkanoate synthesis regulator phasin
MPDEIIEGEITEEAKAVKAEVISDRTPSVTFKASELQVISTKRNRISELQDQILGHQAKIAEKKKEITKLNRQIALLNKSLELSAK